MTNSERPPACSTPFPSSSSPVMPLIRCAVASSKTRPVTAGTHVPLYRILLLLRASRHKLTPRQQERLHEAYVADAPSKCAISSIKPHPPKADARPHISSSAYQRVPSPKSPDWAGPYANGRTRAWPTSTQPEPATAPPKPLTESSN